MYRVTSEQQKVAMLAIIQQLNAKGVDLDAVAEAAKLRILGSPELCTQPAQFRVQCASAVDELIAAALGAGPDEHRER